MTNNAPILNIIEAAKGQYMAKYGFPAETLHASLKFEGALHRWAAMAHMIPANTEERLQGAEVAGLAVVRSTRNTALVEFWLSTTRNGQIYGMQVQIEPEEIGIRKTPSLNTIELSLDENGGVLTDDTEDGYVG